MPRIKLPRLAYNFISASGAFLAVLATMLIVALLAVSSGHSTNPYLGIVVYMVLPPVLIVGLVLIPLGMWLTKRRIERTDEELPEWPFIDLNIPTHRNAFFIFVAGTAIFGIVSIVGAYQSFHFTESTSFCGETCHSVMKPEFVAYQNSPHARVACVACHVGPGADFYAKSKLSGLYQVYATARNIYPRPIDTPVKNLRPARETCEQCHWPQKFHGYQQRTYDHYLYDEESTHYPYTLAIKTGGGDPNLGKEVGGIHWHMNISVNVEYIARDHRRQDIPWMRVTHSDGQVTIYQDTEDPLTPEEIAAAEPRTMDCVDCHNRPSHNYHPPDTLIDEALAAGHASRDLPEIKWIASEAMAEEYETEDEALEGVAKHIMAFYEDDYPEVVEEQKADLDKAVATIQRAYVTNIFPEMKVRWTEYPDNIGHMVYPGCMRCHDGNKVSDQGVAVSRDCTSCHSIMSQPLDDGAELEYASTDAGLEFRHPGGMTQWKTKECYECHTGVEP